MKYLSLDGLKTMYNGILNKIDKKIDAIQIGGQNIFSNSSLVNPDYRSNFYIGNINIANNLGYSSDGLHFTTDDTGLANSNGISFSMQRSWSGLKTGDTVTFSADIKGTLGSGNPAMVYLASTTTSSDDWARICRGQSLQNIKKDQYTRLSITLTLQDLYSDTSRDFFCVAGGFNADIYVKNIKLEIGNKPTAYCVSQQDIDYENQFVHIKLTEMNKFYPFKWYSQKETARIYTLDGSNFTSTYLEIYDENLRYVDKWNLASCNSNSRDMKATNDYGQGYYVKVTGGTMQTLILRNLKQSQTTKEVIDEIHQHQMSNRLLSDKATLFETPMDPNQSAGWYKVMSLDNFIPAYNLTYLLLSVDTNLYRVLLRFSKPVGGLSTTESYIKCENNTGSKNLAIKVRDGSIDFYVLKEISSIKGRLRILDINSEYNAVTLPLFKVGDMTYVENISSDITQMYTDCFQLEERVKTLEAKLTSTTSDENSEDKDETV